MKRKYFNPYFILLLLFTILVGFCMLTWPTLRQHVADGGIFVPEIAEVTLKHDAAFFVSESGDNGTVLKAGQKVKIAARHAKDENLYFLAETSDGRRGVISMFDTTITVKYTFDHRNGGYKMSTHQFNEECIGKRFDEFDGKYRRTVFVPEHPNRTKSVEILMPFILRNTDTWKTYAPIVVYTNGVATDVRYQQIRGRNRLILRFAPFAERLLDNSWVQQLISKPQFVEYEPSHDKTFQDYFNLFIHFIGWMFYIGLCFSVPLYILALMYLFTHAEWLRNMGVIITFVVGFVVGSYLWGLILMMEGYSWWYIWFPPCICFLINFLIYGTSVINQCPKCLYIGTLTRLKAIFLGQELDTYTRKEKVYHVNHSVENGDVVEITYRNDPYHGPEVIKEEQKKGKIDVERGWTEINTYEITDEVTAYDRWYKCEKCGHIHKRRENERRRVSAVLIKSECVDRYEEREARDENRYKYF